MNTIKKNELLKKRRWRIRKKVIGTAERPRLTVRFSSKHIYAQCVNDETQTTLVFSSTLEKDFRAEKLAANLRGAETLGKVFGEKARKSGITRVVFDRNGRPYHGSVKLFADTVRAAGIEF